jgi:hypothetical protein
VRFTKNDIERLATLTHDEVRAAFARSGEYIEHFEIANLAFIDFYIDDQRRLVAHYKARITSCREVQPNAHLYIAASDKGLLGGF